MKVRRFFWAFENDTEAFRDSLHPEIEWFPTDENRTRVSGVADAMRNRNQWLEREMVSIRDATDEIKELIPDLGRGPLAKAKDALTSE